MRRNASTRLGYDPAVVATVTDWLLSHESRRRRPSLVGVSGLQGSGKSTFCAQLSTAIRARSTTVVAMSLDDFYLGRRARAQLAREVHPLLATRGVPGTHDVALLQDTLDALSDATPSRPARIPRFDKGRDTRVSPSRWRRVEQPPRLILLEGWCIGVPAQTDAALRRPLNRLERDEDAGGHWRRWVNDQLVRDYLPLWKRLDHLVLLQAPGFAAVTRWRDEQEHALRRRRAPQAMEAAALARFLMHYERLSRQTLRTLPAHADLRLLLGEDRSVHRIAAADRRDGDRPSTRRASRSASR